MKEKLKRWLLTACAAAGMALACHSARGEKQFVEELVGGAVKNTVFKEGAPYNLYLSTKDPWTFKTANVSNSSWTAIGSPNGCTSISTSLAALEAGKTFAVTVSGDLNPPSGGGSGPVNYSVNGYFNGELSVTPDKKYVAKGQGAEFTAKIGDTDTNANWEIKAVSGGATPSPSTFSDSPSITIGSGYAAGKYEITAKTSGDITATAELWVISVDFDIDPVDNIIKGETPVPVDMTVVPSDVASSFVFSTSNSKVSVTGSSTQITVTGIGVGSSQIRLKIGTELIAELDASVIENTIFDSRKGTVADGATPSIPLQGLQVGMSWPENVEAGITAGRSGSSWKAILTKAQGNYSIQARLNSPTAEVTGPPPGNTTSSNWEKQVSDLDALGHISPLEWYMLAAIIAHENVHASRFAPAFRESVAILVLENLVEKIEVSAETQAKAIEQLTASTAYTNAKKRSYGYWKDEYLVLIENDHNGPCDAAERGVVDPMIRRIKDYAISQGW